MSAETGSGDIFVLLVDSAGNLRSSCDTPVGWTPDEAEARAWKNDPTPNWGRAVRQVPRYRPPAPEGPAPDDPVTSWRIPRSNVVHGSPHGTVTYCGKLMHPDGYLQPFARDLEQVTGPVTCKLCLRSMKAPWRLADG